MEKKEYLPSQSRIKQLKVCLIERINVLNGLLIQLDDVSWKRMEEYLNIDGLDIVGTTIEVSELKIISNSMPMTQQQFEEKIEGLKKSSAEKFDTMVDFTHDDINICLVENTNKNKDIENTLKHLSIDYTEVEHNLLNNSISKISKLSTEEVTTAPLTAKKNNIKDIETSK